MKRTLCRILLLAIFTSSTLAHAADPKIRVEHKLTGVQKGDSGVTLDYSLDVTNPGSTAVTDLTLSLMPRSGFIHKTVTVKIGYLGPRQKAPFPLQVLTPMPVTARWAARVPLSWAGKFIDADGKTVEFPVVSKGGAR